MSSTYSLYVLSAEDIVWKPGPLRSKTPNLYVAVHQDGYVQRTPAIKHELFPQWGHLFKMSDHSYSIQICGSYLLPSSSDSHISLRLFHDSSFRRKDICFGAIDIDVAALVKLCDSDGNPVLLEFKGVDGDSKGKPVGKLSLRLLRDTDTAATAIETAQRDVAKIAPGATSSAIIKAAGLIAKFESAAKDFDPALWTTIVAKLEPIVELGDKIAAIHPYANMAWKILTSVYQVAKKQQATDAKLGKLLQTMVDVYSFVEDTDFLAEKIKSLEDKVLAIVKQTIECSLFIQDYTANGFCSRAIRNTWTNADKKIDELCDVLLRLQDSFDSSLSVQGLFLFTKVLQKLDGLAQAGGHECHIAYIKILDEINEWVMVSSESGNILWLSGVAGPGKSTISTTVSESARGLHRLGGFVFFDRNDRARSHPDGVIRTIAYSLAQCHPDIASAIAVAIQNNPSITNAPIAAQFKTLLQDPLTSVENSNSIQGPIVLVIDALDECGDPGSRGLLLSTLAAELPKFPHFLRVLITSRRDADITRHFHSRFTEKVLDVGVSSMTDVGLFIRDELEKIRLDEEDLGSAWPGEENINCLVDLSGGLFIWASTAVKFIALYDPKEQLGILVTQNSSAYLKLDDLYAVALRNSGPWEHARFAADAHAVLVCVVLGRTPMTDVTMDTLLDFRSLTSAKVLRNLGCVVQWGPGAQARTLHASFSDYLTDPTRSAGKPWTIDTAIGHHRLALGCLKILDTELKFNICGLEDSHLLNADVHDMSDRVAARISAPLSYSCRFWFNHLQEAPFEQTIFLAIDKFYHVKFLYWLEVLSLLCQIPIAVAALGVTSKYIKGHDEDLEAFVGDAMKFVSAFAPVTAQSVPHIYLSAIPFTPQESKIRSQFSGCLPNTLDFESMLGTHWPSIQKVLPHTNAVSSIDFSLDGTRIASVSWDDTLRIWDAQTGTLVAGPFEGHTRCVKFSPDGTRVVSCSDDDTFCVWDSKTGTLIAGPFKGHTDCVNSVQFSSDGTQIVSVSDDNTIRIWDAHNGALITEPLEGHTGRVGSVCFSPDCMQIVSGSYDHTVRIWDAQTGTLVTGPLEGHTGRVRSVHFSPNGTQIVSASNDQTVRIWDAEKGTPIAGPFTGHTDFVTSVNFSPDGTEIVSGSYDHTVRIWDASNYHTVRFWDAHAGTVVAGTFEGHTDSVYSANFSPDGTQIPSRSGDNTFSSDGTQIVSGSDDNTIHIWDAHNGTLIAGPSEGHTDCVNSVQFSSDATQIVSGSSDNTIRIWDSHNGTLIAGPLEGHTGWVNSVQFSSHIVSGS
ncbi:WD40 repeat-like protein [Mycena maculata]|uniref:WD40 repeat-like protein n=1 Tax=Mycena maculata TaxID=230809 RepID=A0AAD7IIQ8_9AGAR|nr:WD40 repeat-like protein [Mycena maculata]